MRPTFGMMAFGSVAAALLTMGARAKADDAVRFVAEYGPHAQALQTFYTNREVRYRSVVPASTSDGWHQESIYKVRYNHENYIFTDEGSTFTGGKPGEAPRKIAPSIAGRNRQYVFRLGVKGPNEYVIHTVTLLTGGRVDPNEATLCTLCFPYADPFVRLTYLEMASDPDHTVLEYSDATWRDGRPVKELKLRRAFLAPGSKEKAFAICSYFFDPANGWVCVGNRARGEKGGDSSGEIFEYEPSAESLPAIKHWENWVKFGNGPETRSFYNDVLEFRRAPDISEEEFRLSAFGLPEPVGVRWEKPTPRYIWFLVAAGVFGALAVGFRYLARRRVARAAG